MEYNCPICKKVTNAEVNGNNEILCNVCNVKNVDVDKKVCVNCGSCADDCCNI